MRHTAIIGALSLLALSALGSADAISRVGWQTYHNDTFGYSVNYPAGLFGPEEEAEDTDGITMISHDGRARLAIFGGPNVAEHTPRTMAESLEGFEEVREVTYRRVAGNWLVLSGYLAEPENGHEMIFYWRVNFDPTLAAISGFRLEYPAAQRDPYDGVIARIGRSLTPPNPG